METPDAGNGDYEHLERPRAGNGKWQRSLETVERGQRAAQLASKGWTLSHPIQGGDGERCGLQSAKWTSTPGRQTSSSTWRIPGAAVIRMRLPQAASTKSAPRRG